MVSDSLPVFESQWITKKDAVVMKKFLGKHAELYQFIYNILTTEVVSWKPCMKWSRIAFTLTLVKRESHLYTGTNVLSFSKANKKLVEQKSVVVDG